MDRSLPFLLIGRSALTGDGGVRSVSLQVPRPPDSSLPSAAVHTTLHLTPESVSHSTLMDASAHGRAVDRPAARPLLTACLAGFSPTRSSVCGTASWRPWRRYRRYGRGDLGVPAGYHGHGTGAAGGHGYRQSHSRSFSDSAIARERSGCLARGLRLALINGVGWRWWCARSPGRSCSPAGCVPGFCPWPFPSRA